MPTIIQKRRGTAAQWAAANSILAEAEEGFEKDTGRIKIGDGVTRWNDLPYWNSDTAVSLPTFVYPLVFDNISNEVSIDQPGLVIDGQNF
jgi:hypothetical protein